MRIERRIVEIDEERCDGCGQCIPACAEGAIQIVDGKARLIADQYCDGLGACLDECPKDALRIIERKADAFNEEAVEEHIKSQASESPSGQITLPCGCPSSQLQSFGVPLSKDQGLDPSSIARAESCLSHWPIKIRLVPPTSRFLKGAHLLVAADCTSFAYPNFHREFLTGKAVMVGCPKFDDTDSYVEKFTQIFARANIRSLTVLLMEVPCCRGLLRIVEKGREVANNRIPLEIVVISTRGTILSKEKLPA